MGVLVVGSVGLDSVKTPFGEVTEVLGGSAIYASLSASLFTDVKLVAVVGEDFPMEYMELINTHPIDLGGLEIAKGRTFRWRGEYTYELNEAITLETELNVFEHFSPKIPVDFREIEFVFLANIDPQLQFSVLEQISSPKLVVADTMNFWIEHKKEALLKTISAVNIMILNDSEARELTGEPNLIKAAKKIISWGPERVIIKKGEHGALMFSDSIVFSAPAYPLEFIFDPTGAGDTFAGGFIGYLATHGTMDEKELRRAIIYGSTMASFVVEDFSIRKLQGIDNVQIKKRSHQFKEMAHFEM